MKKRVTNKVKMALMLIATPFISFGAGHTADSNATYFSNPLFNTLLIIIVILAIMVLTLSNALKNIISSDFFLNKLKKGIEERKNVKASLVILFSLTALASYGAGAAKKVADNTIGGLAQTTFYVMFITIIAELIVLAVLFRMFKKILETKKAKAIVTEPKLKAINILDKINATVAIEEEETILLDHSYDGIKELDNDLPPWWKYGFYLTIVVAVFYMVHYHVSKTGPLQAEEYKTSIKKAEADVAEYMKNSANNVDETTVKLLTDASDIAAGENLFISNCAACHGQSGEGTVGPNLTDDYWLHGGSIQDVFKTIKYGYPDKGMKSWKEDFSPMQIAQLTSFLRTFKGTNPSKPKEKQGELYIEAETANDSIASNSDSTKVLSALK